MRTSPAAWDLVVRSLSNLGALNISFILTNILKLVLLTISLFVKSAHTAVQLVTFYSSIIFFMNGNDLLNRKTLRKMHQKYPKAVQIFEEIKFTMSDLLSSIVRRVSMEFLGSYIIFKTCGCNLSIVWAIACSAVTAIPILNPSMIAILPCLELFVGYSKISGIILIIIHLTMNFKFLPQLSTSHLPEAGNYILWDLN